MGICMSLSPGISGQEISFSIPRALMTTSALSSNVSPVILFLMVMNLDCVSVNTESVQVMIEY